MFKRRNLHLLGEMIVGDVPHFLRRSSSYITEFMEDCDLEFVHRGETRRHWAAEVVETLLAEPVSTPNTLPERFINLLRVLMDKRDAVDDDADRSSALACLNRAMTPEGFEAYYDDNERLQLRHIATQTDSEGLNPHRPFTPEEIKRRGYLIAYLDRCSEDELIDNVLLPLLRQVGYQKITAAGHKDKNLEHGKDIWMRFTLPSQHILYFGVQVKKGKLDASADSRDRRGANHNIAVIHNQILMMLDSEIFDPDVNRRRLVDHAFIVAGGEITKSARLWLGSNLDRSKRSRIMFMDREDIVSLFIASRTPLPSNALPPPTEIDFSDDMPF